MTKSLFRPSVLAIVACLWWLAVILYDFLRYAPNPSIGSAWIDWRQMDIVFRVAPWMMLPFAALAVWTLASRRASASLNWIFGIAALSWTAFVFWRAHQQSFTCAAWAPREEFWSNANCFMPHLLGSSAAWLAIPVAAWIVIAAAKSLVPMHSEPSKPIS